MDITKWRTIGLTVPRDVEMGGRDFVRCIKKYFDLLWSDATKETKDAIKADPLFKIIQKVIS